MTDHHNDLEEALNGLAAEGGVTHYLIINPEGVPIRWSGWGKQKEDLDEITQLSALTMGLASKCKHHVKSLLEPGENGVETFRLRTLKNEIIVAPGKYMVVDR
jgi:hypothetical protein